MKTQASLNFSHSPETITFWKRLVREALSLSPATPFFVFSALPVAERISELDAALAAAGFQSAIGNRQSRIVCRHWLSCKTQPVAPLLRWWREQGRAIEVVSEFELRAALEEGFVPENILVNGPAKHHWLPQLIGAPSTGPARFVGVQASACPGGTLKRELQRAEQDLGAPIFRGLSVNFDSPAELAALLPLAKNLNWRCGVRINTAGEFDPENPQFPTQFGFTPDEAVAALKKLRRAKVRTETIHFHLRTNISSVQIYQRAIAEVAEVCRAAKFSPLHLDIGGGFPVRHVLTRGGKVFDGEFGLRAFTDMLRQSAKLFPGLREIWLENGRWVSAGSGALVMKILDVKERRHWGKAESGKRESGNLLLRQFICDGGRTLNALTSLWEQHKILTVPERSGAETLTAVHGPTCMAFDQLARISLPRSLRAGDHLVWLDAGAYHIPWETRFSHGHAAVLWHDENGLRLARERQSFEEFWGQWK
jgi:diaminopimelate decarboxylase